MVSSNADMFHLCFIPPIAPGVSDGSLTDGTSSPPSRDLDDQRTVLGLCCRGRGGALCAIRSKAGRLMQPASRSRRTAASMPIKERTFPSLRARRMRSVRAWNGFQHALRHACSVPVRRDRAVMLNSNRFKTPHRPARAALAETRQWHRQLQLCTTIVR